MILTVSLLSKGSFLGSLINKCRQVVRIKTDKHIETKLNHQIFTSPNIKPPQSPVVENVLASNTNRPVAVANISLSSRSAARTLEEQAGLPPKPKRPLTPYFRFMREQMPKLRASNPKLAIIDIVKQISKKWQTEDPSLKQRLQEEYKKEQQQYIEIRTKYDAKITEEQRYQLKELKQERIETKERRRLRRRIKELGRPKKPASAFIRFMAAEKTITPRTSKQTFREFMQACSAKWARLSDEEKQVYMQEARKELEIYKKEISLWEEKMIRLGHSDVVRQGNLIDLPEPKKR